MFVLTVGLVSAAGPSDAPGGNPGAPAGLTAAASDPTAGDPNRPHQDPGAWPLMVFIVGIFAMGLIVRGSRSKKRAGPGPQDRRQPENGRRTGIRAERRAPREPAPGNRRP